MTVVTRHLITFGVSDYEHPKYHVEDVRSSVERVTRAFEQAGYTHALDLSSAASKADLFERLHEHLQKPVAQPALLALHVMAHGEVDQGRHVLLLKQHGRGSAENTLVGAEDLVRTLAREPRRYQGVLLILDSCFSGAAAEQVVEAAVKSDFGRSNEEFLDFVATARAIEEASAPAFASALDAVINDVAQQRDLFATRGVDVPLQELLRRVDARMVGEPNAFGKLQALRHSRAGAVPPAGLDFFPNPHHDPQLPLQQTLEVENWLVASSRDQRDHWLTKARGIASGSGWYFTGREHVLDALAAYLSDDVSDGKVRVVTGSPGAGKSAVLGQLVVRSHPALAARAARGSNSALALTLTVSIWARRKTLGLIVNELARGVDLTLTATSPRERTRELLERLSERPERTSIVVDALDEANEPRAIGTELLAPLAKLDGVRLVVGTRRELVRELGQSCVVVDLDADTQVERSLVDYVEARLLRRQEPTQSTPYRDEAQLARRVAEVVAERAQPLFLVAQLVADALLLRKVATPPAQLDALPATVDEAFGQYLDRVGSGEDRERVVNALLPLAHAQGEGLPRATLWPALAQALSDGQSTEADVDHACRVAAAYIVHDRVDGQDVYRLYHEALADYLRRDRDEKSDQRKIVETLLALLPEYGGEADLRVASPYVRTHLAAHAAKAGMLEGLLKNPLFLLESEPQRLLAVLPSVEGSMEASTFEHAEHLMRGRARGEAAAYLQLSAHKLGAEALAKRVDALDLTKPWSARWTSWQVETPHRVLAKLESRVTSLAATELEGESVLVVGTENGSLYVLSAQDGTTRGEPMRGHTKSVTCLAVYEHAARPCVVSGSRDETLRCWDLLARAPVGQPMCKHEGRIASVAVYYLDSLPYAISGSDDCTLRRWDLSSGAAHGEPLKGHEGAVTCVATYPTEGTLCAVSGSHDLTLRRWSLRDGSSVGPPLRGHSAWVTSLAVYTQDGHPCAVSGSLSELRRWNLSHGLQFGVPIAAHQGWVTSIAVYPLNGQACALSGSEDCTLARWSLRDGSALGGVMRGNAAEIAAIVVAPSEAFSASLDSIRRWSLGEVVAQVRSADRDRDGGGVATIALCQVRSSPCIVSSVGGSLRRWSLLSGSRCWNLRCEQTDLDRDWGQIDRLREAFWGTYGLAVYHLRDRACAVAGAADWTLKRWNLSDGSSIGQPMGVPVIDPRDAVTSVAVYQRYAYPCAIAGSGNGALGRWNLHDGSSLGWSTQGHDLGVTAVATYQLGNQPFAVSASADTTLRRWNLLNGEPLHSRWHRASMRGHEGPVTSVAIYHLSHSPFVVSGSMDCSLRRWNLKDGSSFGEPLRGHESCVRSVAAYHLGALPCAVSGSDDHTLRMWNLGTGQELQCVDLGTSILSLAVQWLEQELYIVAGTSRGIVTLRLDAASLHVLCKEQHD